MGLRVRHRLRKGREEAADRGGGGRSRTGSEKNASLVCVDNMGTPCVDEATPITLEEEKCGRVPVSPHGRLDARYSII